MWSAEPEGARGELAAGFSSSSRSTMRPQMHQEQTAAEDKTESESSENEEDTKKVKRRKLGADKEMMRAFLSTTEFNPSRLRPRKEIPVLDTKASKKPDLTKASKKPDLKKPAQDVIDFRMLDLSDIDGPSLIGRRVEVYWPDSRRWFRGRVKTFDHQKLVHKVDYDDGDWERLDLKNEVFRMEVFPGENLKIKPECNTKKKVKLPRSKVASERKLIDGHVKEDVVDGRYNYLGVREKEFEKAGIFCTALTDTSIAAHPDEVKDKMVEVGAEYQMNLPQPMSNIMKPTLPAKSFEEEYLAILQRKSEAEDPRLLSEYFEQRMGKKHAQPDS